MSLALADSLVGKKVRYDASPAKGAFVQVGDNNESYPERGRQNPCSPKKFPCMHRPAVVFVCFIIGLVESTRGPR